MMSVGSGLGLASVGHSTGAVLLRRVTPDLGLSTVDMSAPDRHFWDRASHVLVAPPDLAHCH
jgi:hypothetical protein